MQSASVELITTMHGDSVSSRQRRMCSMIGSGFVTSKECKCWSTISSVSTTPNRWPERKVGDRGETRLADISPCMFMGKKDKRGKDFKHPGRTRRRRGWRQAGPVGGRRRTSWRFPYIYTHIYQSADLALDLDTVLAVRVGKYCIRAYGIRHFQFPRRRRRHAQGPAILSFFYSACEAARPSSSGQWINSSGPIGLVLSASTHAIPLFSLFLHWPRTCMYFLHSRMIILKSISNTKLLI